MVGIVRSRDSVCIPSGKGLTGSTAYMEDIRLPMQPPWEIPTYGPSGFPACPKQLSCVRVFGRDLTWLLSTLRFEVEFQKQAKSTLLSIDVYGKCVEMQVEPAAPALRPEIS